MRRLPLLFALATLILATAHARPVKIVNRGTMGYGGNWVHVNIGTCAGQDLGGIGGSDIPPGGSRLVEYAAINLGQMVNATWQELNGTWQCGNFALVQEGSTPELRIWPGLSGDPGSPPQNWKISKCVTNKTGVTVDYELKINGVVSDKFTLPPGASYCVDYTGNDKADIRLNAVGGIYNQDGSIAGREDRPVMTIGSNDGGWYQEGDPPPGPGGVSDKGKVDKEKNSKDDPHINFGLGSDLAKDETVRTGFSAMYGLEQQALDAINNSIRSQYGKLSAIDNAVNQGLLNINGTLQSLGSLQSLANGKLTDIAVNTLGTKNGVDALGGKLDTGNARLGDIQAGLGTLNNTASGISTKLDGIDGHIVFGNGKLGSIEEKATGLRDDLSGVNSKLQTGNAFLGGIEGKLQDIKNNTAGTVQRIEITNEKLTEIKTAVDGVKSALGQPVLTNIHTELVRHTEILSVGTNVLTRMADTLQALTNQADYTTNLNTLTNLQGEVGWSVALAEQAKFETYRGLVVGALSESAQVSSVTADAYWKATLAGHTFDLNPLHAPYVGSVFAWFRQVIFWLATLGYLIACWHCTEQAIHAITAARQATSAAGTPVVSSGIALAIAAAITGAVALIPAAFFVSVAGNGTILTALAAKPFVSTVPVIANGIWLLDQFVPVGAILGYIVSYVSFRMAGGGIYTLASTVIRFLVG